ncbi:MAG: metallophosphoesterase [Kiritimatiellae bacterium]|nr:metallophosphoesterase [Kiritimatiellia bacterium]
MERYSRRGFLGMAAFAAVGGFSVRTAAQAAGLAKGGVKLRFGAISDVHISAGGIQSGHCGDTTILERALAYFRDQNVDGVVIAGDMADWGLVEQLEAVGVAWRKVFPGNKAKGGKHVEKLFVYGNHDTAGHRYSYVKRYKLPESMFAKERTIAADKAGAWKKAFGEDWKPIMRKEVNGYTFILCHELEYPVKGPYADFLERNRSALEGAKPFFYVQHYHPRGTTSAPMTWGQDSGASTEALSKFPNAIAFSGHSHVPLVDDRVIWQGSFTSVGTASLRYLIPLGGRENTAPFGAEDPAYQQMPRLELTDCQHGELVTVYGDCLTIERRDFANGLPVGADWVVPLAFDGSLSFAARAAKAPVPQFGAGALVTVAATTGANRKKETVPQFTVSFPNLLSGVRAFDFDVAVEGVDVDVQRIWMTKRVFSRGFYRAPQKDVPVVTCVFAPEELPPPYRRIPKNQSGLKYRFSVRPCNCWGMKGKPIYSKWFTDIQKELKPR